MMLAGRISDQRWVPSVEAVDADKFTDARCCRVPDGGPSGGWLCSADAYLIARL